MARTQDIQSHLGVPWEIDATCYDADRSLLNIVSAQWIVADDTHRVIKVTNTDTITIVNPGTLKIKVSAELQVGITAGVYKHELYVVGPDSDTASIQVVGKIVLLETLHHKFP